MIEQDIYHKIVEWAIYPVVAILSFFFKKTYDEAARTQEEVQKIKTKQAILSNNFINMREDIHEIKDSLKDILKEIKCNKNN